MAAQVAGRRRHPLWLAAEGLRSSLRTCCAKSLRILICSLQTDNSELPMRAVKRSSRGFAMPMPLAVLKKLPWSCGLNAPNRSHRNVPGQGCTASEDRSLSEEFLGTCQLEPAGARLARAWFTSLRVRTSEPSGPAAAVSRCHAIPRRTEAKRRRTEHTRSYFTRPKSVPLRIQRRARDLLTRLKGPQGTRQNQKPAPPQFEPALVRAPASTSGPSSRKRYEA